MSEYCVCAIVVVAHRRRRRHSFCRLVMYQIHDEFDTILSLLVLVSSVS